MKRQLYSIDEVVQFIEEGRYLVISGGEDILSKLPKGNWIGGTSTYFMNVDHAVHTKNKVFVDDLTDIGINYDIRLYSNEDIKNIAVDAFDNGFTVVIIPNGSSVYNEFSLHSLSYDQIFNNPVVGFISGVLEDEVAERYGIGNACDNNENKSDKVYLPLVFDGRMPKMYGDYAVAIHVELPDNKMARAEVLNVETIDKKSPTITFPKTSFTQSDCLINGEKHNIADFLIEVGYQSNYNLVADYNGFIVSRDIKEINPLMKEVSFFSPVFDDEVYYLANRIDDYKELFDKNLLYYNKDNVPYSCICISYYMRGSLNNKKINMEGVFGFGEIAFHTLNRTLVFLEIDEF